MFEAWLPWLWAIYQICVGYITLVIVAALQRDYETGRS